MASQRLPEHLVKVSYILNKDLKQRLDDYVDKATREIGRKLTLSEVITQHLAPIFEPAQKKPKSGGPREAFYDTFADFSIEDQAAALKILEQVHRLAVRGNQRREEGEA